MDKKLSIRRVENEDLAQKTKKALIEIICRNADGDKPFKFPNEDELSQSLGVSRNVLRDALMSLEDVGIVTRRRSIGTIANPKIAREQNRLDINPELSRMIQDAGYTVRVDTLRLGFVFERDDALAEGDDAYLNVEKVFFADGEPVAYCADHIAGHFARNAENSIMQLRNISHYEFLDRLCGTTMAYTMAHIDAVAANEALCEVLKAEPGDVLLRMEDFAYNYDHAVVVHSVIYFRRGYLDLKFLRKNW